MTHLDQAMQTLHEDPENNENRHRFYSSFLQTEFFVPTFDKDKEEIVRGEGLADEPEKALPLVMESEGNHYLMLFDEAERVRDWADEDIKCIKVPGYVIVSMATEGLHLAMNVGTDYSKQFVPDEIAWLRQVVQKSTEGGEEGGEG